MSTLEFLSFSVFASSSSSPPAALALALLSLPEIALDMKAAAPVVTRSLPVVASELSLIIDSAIEMPTPVLDDLVSPVAVFSTELVSVDEALKPSSPMVSGLT